MEKNYYEILEVDKNASQEIIEKAYRILAKKYHPDLQNEETKQESEEKMKAINEAYAVLSDDYKKTTYDEQLQKQEISIEEYQNLVQENIKLRKEIERLQSNISTNNYKNTNIVQNMANQYEKKYTEKVNEAVQQAYKDAYVQDMKNRGYRFKNKLTIKDYIKMLIYLGCVILVIMLIVQIPPIKRFLVDLYENNILIQAIVDVFKNTFTTKF